MLLNTSLDIESLAKEYATKKRLQVSDIFQREIADRIYQALASEVPWSFAYRDGTSKYIWHDKLEKLTNSEHKKISDTLYKQARKGFQYAYNCYPLLEKYPDNWKEIPILSELRKFLNSDAMLNFIRAVTGSDIVNYADAQATRYVAGHFLKQHSDEVAGEGRVVAYILNLTPTWDPDWGGYLQFYDERRDIEEALMPRYNMLNLFTVPQTHAVSYVANYATEERLSITGWFRQ